MITTQYGEVIPRSEMLAEINGSNSVSFRIMGLSFDNFVGMDMAGFNEMFLDNSVEDGHLFMDITYKLYNLDQDGPNEVGVEVHVADVSEYVNSENH